MQLYLLRLYTSHYLYKQVKTSNQVKEIYPNLGYNIIIAYNIIHLDHHHSIIIYKLILLFCHLHSFITLIKFTTISPNLSLFTSFYPNSSKLLNSHNKCLKEFTTIISKFNNRRS